MGVAAHLGIQLREYDARIRTFIPDYEEMLDAAAAAFGAAMPPRHARTLVVDLGVGSGALAARCVGQADRVHIIGIDADDGMLGLARKRLGSRLTLIAGDFLNTRLPRCAAVTASFSLHHVRTRRLKAKLYRRCFAALEPGGVFVNADCCLASNPQLQKVDRAAWRTHLERQYSRRQSENLLRAWGREDVYLRLDDEVALLRAADFIVDVPWRRHSFAVIVGLKSVRSGRPRPSRSSAASPTGNRRARGGRRE